MTALVDQRRALVPKWTKDQIELMKRTIAKGTTDDEFKMFLYTCKRTGLDPFIKQIYAIKRYDSESGGYIMGVQTGIDGYRLIASRTGELAGIDAPVFEVDANETWHPATATVTVYRMMNGERMPYTHTVRWSEYYQKKKDGSPTRMWSAEGMPFNQLGKCAEAGALRKAFPYDLSGLTTADESPVIDITGADGVSGAAPQEPQRADTKAEELYTGQLVAYDAKNPQRKTPHRFTFRVDAGGDIQVSAFEAPACLKAGEALIGKRFQFSYEEKPNPRGGEPFRNLKHAALEIHDMPAEEPAEQPKAPAEKPKEKPAEKPSGPLAEAQMKAFADLVALMDSATSLEEIQEIYTGTVQKNWHRCAVSQRQELSTLYGKKKKDLGGEE